jgi:hypothetical protein
MIRALFLIHLSQRLDIKIHLKAGYRGQRRCALQ